MNLVTDSKRVWKRSSTHGLRFGWIMCGLICRAFPGQRLFNDDDRFSADQ